MRLLHTSASLALRSTGLARPSIGLALFGCANRPAYRICVLPDRALGRIHEGKIIEELGVYDPLPNSRGEKLVALDIERIKYWIGVRNAHVSVSLLELLGLCGVLPVHPKTYIRARHNRERIALERSTRVEGSIEAEKQSDISCEQSVGEGIVQEFKDSTEQVSQSSEGSVVGTVKDS